MNQSIFWFLPFPKRYFFENLFITQLTLGVATNYTINVVMERLDVLRIVTADMVYFVTQVEGISRKEDEDVIFQMSAVYKNNYRHFYVR